MKKFVHPFFLLSASLFLSACEINISINKDSSDEAQPAEAQPVETKTIEKATAPQPEEPAQEPEKKPVQKLSSEAAVHKISYLLGIEENGDYQVAVDHIDESGNYIIKAFYGIGSSHPFTLGYYSVHPETAFVTDLATGETVTIKKYHLDYTSHSNGYITYNTGTFIADFPESYVVYPTHSFNNNEYFRMATVDPGNKNIRFFVYSGPANETPEVFTANRSFETLQDSTEDSNVRWYTIEADDGSYIKTFERTYYNDGTQLIVGLMFDSWDTYNQYKPQYLQFKSSVKKQ